MKTAARIRSAAYSLIVIFLVSVAVLTVVPRFFGIKTYAVMSGSMEPAYRTGDLLYVRKVKAEKLDVGDPVTFLTSEGNVVTHRITEKCSDGEDPDVILFTTKGDANEIGDARPVSMDRVIGKPFMRIPYLGRVSVFLQSRTGRYLVLAAVLSMILGKILRSGDIVE